MTNVLRAQVGRHTAVWVKSTDGEADGSVEVIGSVKRILRKKLSLLKE
jgi:hypothetical protein